MKNKIVVDCEGLNEKGISDVEGLIFGILESSEMSVYVKVTRE